MDLWWCMYITIQRERFRERERERGRETWNDMNYVCVHTYPYYSILISYISIEKKQAFKWYLSLSVSVTNFPGHDRDVRAAYGGCTRGRGSRSAAVHLWRWDSDRLSGKGLVGKKYVLKCQRKHGETKNVNTQLFFFPLQVWWWFGCFCCIGWWLHVVVSINGVPLTFIHLNHLNGIVYSEPSICGYPHFGKSPYNFYLLIKLMGYLNTWSVWPGPYCSSTFGSFGIWGSWSKHQAPSQLVNSHNYAKSQCLL